MPGAAPIKVLQAVSSPGGSGLVPGLDLDG
jgi:hypothetical protein